jgi:hypothetical protein
MTGLSLTGDLGALFEISDREVMERVEADDVAISADGRVTTWRARCSKGSLLEQLRGVDEIGSPSPPVGWPRNPRSDRRPRPRQDRHCRVGQSRLGSQHCSVFPLRR